MKKIFFILILLAPTLIKSVVEKIIIIDGDHTSSLLTKIGKTKSSEESPDISTLIQKNRKFFARLYMGEEEKWFTFQNNIDANNLQKICSRGYTREIEWYYEDNNADNNVQYVSSSNSPCCTIL